MILLRFALVRTPVSWAMGIAALIMNLRKFPGARSDQIPFKRIDIPQFDAEPCLTLKSLGYSVGTFCVPSVTATKQACNRRVKIDGFPGDKSCQNGDNRINPCRQISFGTW